MDNFMDKLVQKWNAGEQIRANSEAEAMELRRLREQVAVYEEVLQEMRKLNLKNAELAEQTRESVSKGMKELGELVAEGKQSSRHSHRIEEKTDAVLDKIGEIQEKLESDKQDSTQEFMDKLMDKIEDFVHKENVKVYRNVQAVVVDSLKEQTEAIKTETTAIQKKTGGILPLFLILLLLSVGNITILILQILGIL